MNASRSFAITLTALMAGIIATLPMTAAAQGTAVATTQQSPTTCPQGDTALLHRAQPGDGVCKAPVNSQGTGVASKHAINTKGTGSNRSAAPITGNPVTGPTGDLDGDAARKTGHVTVMR